MRRSEAEGSRADRVAGERTSGNAAKWPQGAAVGRATHQTGNDRAPYRLVALSVQLRHPVEALRRPWLYKTATAMRSNEIHSRRGVGIFLFEKFGVTMIPMVILNLLFGSHRATEVTLYHRLDLRSRLL